MTDDEIPRIEHNGFRLMVSKLTYEHGGRTCLQLYDEEDYLPYATATANLPDVPLDDDKVLIKNYSENEGLSSALQKGGITEFTGETVPSGYVELEVHRLLI